MQSAQLHAFCILPDHVHIIMSPGMKGLSAFVHSWKRNTMRDVRRLLPTNIDHAHHVTEVDDDHSYHVAEDRIFRVKNNENLRVHNHENLREHIPENPDDFGRGLGIYE